tara:strand:+ start:407 stop:694 length:288 start_codon:yes stop_codon:yes gene_type:complete
MEEGILKGIGSGVGGKVPAYGKFKLAHFCTIGKIQQIRDLAPFLESYVMNDSCSRIPEMNMGRRVHAKSGWFPVEIHLIDQAMFCERIKAVIHSG